MSMYVLMQRFLYNTVDIEQLYCIVTKTHAVHLHIRYATVCTAFLVVWYCLVYISHTLDTKG